MAREIITIKDIERYQEIHPPDRTLRYLPDAEAYAAVPLKADTYFDRLLKYIPAEIVAAYVFTSGVIQKVPDPGKLKILHWLIFAVFSLITFFYLWRILNVRKASQLAISVMSFIVWVFALGGPFSFLSWYDPVYGQVLLPVFTFFIAIIQAER